MSDETASQENTPHSNEDVLLDLNFVPQWAKREPADNHYAFEDRPERRPLSRDRHNGPRREYNGGLQDHPSRTSRLTHGQFSEDRRAVSGGVERRPLHEPRGERIAQTPHRERVLQPERIELPVEIKFLPEQKWLSSMVRQIHHSKRAYPLMDLASLFLSDPKGHLVKIEVAPNAKEFKLYQGKFSKIVATNRDGLIHQLLNEHLGDFFSREDIEVAPPVGIFPMIGRIGEVLIGPPNHHSYAARLQQVYNERFSGMPFGRFKQKVETVRDEALIAKWKEEACKKTVYRLKVAPEGGTKDFTLAQAEDYLRTQIAEAEIEEVTRAVLPSALARKIQDDNLIRMVREAWERESRFPMSVAFTLRAKFRHQHLQTFKAGKNINFVTSVRPDPIHPGKAVAPIRLVLEYLSDHPGSTREQLVEGLRPGIAQDSPQAHDIIHPLRWLIEKGHIIEFFNGTLSVLSRRLKGSASKDLGGARPSSVPRLSVTRAGVRERPEAD